MFGRPVFNGRAVFFVGMLACLQLPLRSQTLKGATPGSITDSNQIVISGVQVSVTGVNTNSHRTELTNSD